MTARLKAAFAARTEPYAGADMAAARRLGAALWIIATALAVLLLPLSPPTEALGTLGWLPAIVAIGAMAAVAVVLRSSLVIGWTHMLASSFIAIGAVAVLQWLAGGAGLPYDRLLLLPAVYTTVIHPPRRIAAAYMAIAAALAAPFVYDGWNQAAAAGSAVAFVLLTGIAVAGFVLMQSVRDQRIALRREGNTAREEARRDGLTGLGNRRSFDEALEVELQRATRSNTPLSIILIDVEAFKQINDGWGHVEGDRCLCEVGSVIRRAVRLPDLTFRWGGDEFALILPQTDYVGAELLGQRLISEIEHRCRRPDDQPMRIRVGAAESRAGEDVQTLLGSADLALTEAKLRSSPHRVS